MENKQQTDQEKQEDFLHEDPVIDEALDWFLLIQGGDLDQASQDRFQAWIAENPRHEEEFVKLGGLWDSVDFEEAAGQVKTDRFADGAPAGSEQPLMTGEQATQPRKWLYTAAAVCLLIFGFYQFSPFAVQWQADYRTAYGDLQTITLSDGTVMTLNSGSAVALDFSEKTRTIRLLKGEAFFDVTRNAARPFRVSSGLGEVTVLGTAFAVRTGDVLDRVILEHGRLAVRSHAKPNENALLTSGDMITVSETSLSAKKAADLKQLLAWRRGRVIFSSIPLSQALAEFERYTDKSIFLLSPDKADLAVSGNYRIDDMNAALTILAEATGLTATTLPGGLVFLR